MVRAADLAALRVLNDRGDVLELGELWRDRPAVLALVRHFG